VVNLGPLDAEAPLAEALARVRGGRGRLWTVTRGAQPVSAAPTDRGGAAVWGLLRVLPVEQPERWGGLIDLDPARPAEAQAAALGAALTSVGEDQLAWRGGEWRAARLVPVPAADLGAAETVAPAEAGAWLVTGGLGGLGWAAAEWLVGRGAAAVLLVGRRGANPEQAGRLEAWRRRGLRVEAAAVDCGDAEALARAVRAWKVAGGAPIGGVIHAAGAWRDAPLADLDAAGLEAVWRPKVAGAQALESALAGDPVGHWIYFSAFSAWLPAAGQGNYAAANAWLDAQARRQRAAGGRALALNWGPWSELGFATTDYGMRAHQRLEALGIGRFRPADGLAVLARALASGRPQIGAMPLDAPRFFAADPQARLSPILAEVAARALGAAGPDRDEGRIAKRLAAAAPEEHGAILAEELRRLVGGVLRLAPEAVPGDIPLTELGLDSLVTVEIKNRLQRQAGIDVPFVELLRGPTVASLAASLLPRVKLAALAYAGPAAGPVEEIEL
jgi:NAD(P)-dependent dehydrogenase (short-subunit alcohol dehydrogenase family)/aryl carrier-like protein